MWFFSFLPGHQGCCERLHIYTIWFIFSLFLCILGGQSDQGYGSKDELHQDSIDACKTTAFPLSDDGQANKSKTVKGKQNSNADNRGVISLMDYSPLEIIVSHDLVFASSFA